MRTFFQFLASTAALAVMFLSACATPFEVDSQMQSDGVTPDMLVNQSPLAGDLGPQDVAGVNILELTPEMRSYIDDHIRDRTDENERLRLLIFAVMGERTFRLEYDESTRTAAETFRDRRGNCLSFTNMFIAMARYVGLEARYQEVDVPPDWSMSGQAFLLSRHVNLEVRTRYNDVQIIDFNVYDFKIRHNRRIISDRRGRAHYFNNLGAELMLSGDTEQALVHFQQSLIEDDDFSPAWINLGILYRREGYPAYAEAAFRHALELDHRDLVAMSNLASLYEAQGFTETALLYRERVESHRMKNPYYRYLLANEAFAAGDYQTAVEHLDFAIDKRRDEDRFLALMGMSRLMLGDRKESEKWMRRAEEAASKDADKLRYHNKLELLLRQDMDRG